MIKSIYIKLYDRYGNLNWWPASSPYEVIVGAVLTQNTAWSNVEKAIKNFGDNLTAEFISSVSHGGLINIIRPSGFYNQKAEYLKSITKWYSKYNFDIQNVKNESAEKL